MMDMRIARAQRKRHALPSMLALLLLLPAGAAGAGEAEKPSETTDPAGAAEPDEFAELALTIQRGDAGITEDDVKRMLTRAKALGRPFVASQAVKAYFKTNTSPSQEILRLAAENAEQAGDLHTAVTRYGAYLKTASATPEASEAMARMYHIMLEFLQTRDDAYLFWKRHGQKHRHSANARKYDHAFISEAIRRGEYQQGVDFLVKAHAEARGANKALYHDHVMTLVTSLMSLDSEKDLQTKGPHAAVLQAAGGILPGDWRRDYVGVAAAYLKCRWQFHQKGGKAMVKGKPTREAQAAFAPVLAKASAWFDKDPRPVTVYKIYLILGGGDRDRSQWRALEHEKRAFFRYAWDKGNEPVRRWLMGSTGHVNGHELLQKHWMKDVSKHHWLLGRFDHRAAADYLNGKKADEIKKIAARISKGGGWLGTYARMIASGPEPAKAVDVLMAEHGKGADTETIRRVFFESRCFEAHKRAWGRKDSHAEALTHYWVNYFATSAGPLLDRRSARDIMEWMWRYVGMKDVKRIGQTFRALNWVPYSANHRSEIFQRARKEFGRWKGGPANQLRDLKKKKKKKKLKPDEEAKILELEKTVVSLSKMEAILIEVMDSQVHARSKCPNAVTEQARKLAVALGAKKRAAAPASAKALFGSLKGATFGRVTAKWLSRSSDWTLRLSALQEALAHMQATGDDSLADGILQGFEDRRRGWPHNIPSEQKLTAKKVNEMLTAAFCAELGKGRFHKGVFHWIRGTRQGRGWNERGWGEAAAAKVIEGDWFNKAPRMYGHWPASLNYMALVASEFPGLNKTYPVKSHFDAMFVREAQEQGYMHSGYYDGKFHHYGNRDGKGLLAAHVTAMWKQGKDPFIDGHGSWLRRLQAGGGSKHLTAYFKQRHGANQGVDHASLGWNALRYGDLSKENAAKRKAYFSSLRAYVDGTRTYQRVWQAPTFGPIEKVGHTLTKDELDTLLLAFDSHMSFNGSRRDHRGAWSNLSAAWIMHSALLKKGRSNDLFRIIPYVWKLVRDNRDRGTVENCFRAIDGYINGLAEKGKHELAAAYSTAGIQIGRHLPDYLRKTLESTNLKAMASIGSIPVPATDPRYGLFKAQLNYVAGSRISAWNVYRTQRELIPEAYKELDIEFLTWLVHKHAEVREFEDADGLARLLIRWVDSRPGLFAPKQRGDLFMAYANIAYAKKEYPVARAKYEAIREDRTLAASGVPAKAELRVAEIDRLTKNFDKALDRLERLARRSNPALRVGALYQLALCKYDLEEYEEALKILDRVMMLRPDHADAHILKAKLNLQRKKLEEATEIDLGVAMAQRVIVPGKPFKVKLEDRNLAVVGKTSQVEIRAWTSSGDEEHFNLYSFADSETRFRGVLPTKLGAPRKGDNVLQLLGDDKIRYDFSEAFKKRNNVKTKSSIWLMVRTDASLEASSGRILSKEEKEEIQLRAMLAAAKNQKSSSLNTARNTKSIKPGNKVYLRVEDPDMSTTGEADKVSVSAHTSSGDSIRALVLTETGADTGVFTGVMETTKAPPVAYASDVMEGREPGFAISHKEYPAWSGAPDNKRPKWFSVDLNDNVAIKNLTIVAKENGRRLKDFLIQTSFDNRRFRTVGSWPRKVKPWNGSLQLEVVKMAGKSGRMTGIGEYLDWRHLTAKVKKGAYAQSAFSMELKPEDFTKGKLGGLGIGKTDTYVARLRGAFYLDKGQTRIFTVKPGEATDVSYKLLLDGNPVYPPARGGRGTEVRKDFKRILLKGVHTLELQVTGTAAATASFDLMVNVNVEPFIAQMPAALFDQAKHPEIAREYRVQLGTVAQDAEKGQFQVNFPDQFNGRVVRLLLLDYEGQAPAINKIHLVDAKGQQVLPSKQDFRELRKNSTLEIVAGDKIGLKYKDTKPLTPGKGLYEDGMEVVYTNANLNTAFVEYTTRKGEQIPSFIPLVRFKREEPVVVFVNDADADVSKKRDTVDVTVQVTGKEKITLKAMETLPQSGVFTARLFPSEKPGKRPNDLQMGPDDNITVTYRDEENTDPGVPWDREKQAIQVMWFEPQLRLFSTKIVDAVQGPAKNRRGKAEAAEEASETPELPKKALLVTRPSEPENDKPATAYIETPVTAELIWPSIVLSPRSKATIYAQTSSGRKKHGKDPAGPYDIEVPGTVKISVTPSTSGGRIEPPEGIAQVLFKGELPGDALEQGIFTFSIPTKLGDVPDHSLATEDAQAAEGTEGKGATEPMVLAVNGRDTIHVGFHYTDWNGKEHWITQDVTLVGLSALAALDKKYEAPLEGIHVGEDIYYRLVDKMLDTSPERDTVELQLDSSRGKLKLKLVETFEHTGEFRGLVSPVYAEEDKPVPLGKLGVVYGDRVVANYEREGVKLSATVPVHKGADGLLASFTKRFKDADMGVKTQFSIAEAFFELAKKHRRLGKKDISRREIKQGKRLLEEALRDMPNSEIKAQADYLLAELSLEFGNDATNKEIKRKYYMEAIGRFSKIVSSNPDSAYAPKAQYKKALTFEKIGELDKACEEYVKLSYRYPNNELVAETISRLGQYFWKKGRAFNKLAKEKGADEVKVYKMKERAKAMYRTSAEVFARLQARFPAHKLAGKTTLLAGQAYILAAEHNKAVELLLGVIDSQKKDKKLVPEAMYWCADCYAKMESPESLILAYRMFKRLTWNYPESRWARFARGRLTERQMLGAAKASDG